MDEPPDIVAHLDIADQVAALLWRRFRFLLTFEELRSEAQKALVLCGRTYVAGDVSFRKWAGWKCPKLVFDSLRQQRILRSPNTSTAPPKVFQLGDFAEPSHVWPERLNPVDAFEADELVDELLADVPELVRQAIRLYYADELPMKEVGRRLGRSEAWVSEKLSRWIRIIRLQHDVARSKTRRADVDYRETPGPYPEEPPTRGSGDT